ncbi:hypothetical protein CJU90_4667 [Yarrowia sp. C11]|nr:hypothetical protein CJU90_4667 [Yarrowia sp. C11]KAG5370605.1 hypothetical protein CKK34_0716 [Yarrowia sp. E02]
MSLPIDFKYVIAATSLYPVLGFFQTLNTGYWRAKSKTPLPLLFADTSVPDKEPKLELAKQRFNCAQKAHMQFNENAALTLVAGWISGLYCPQFAASLLLTWAVSRFAYVIAYSKGNPENRKFPALVNLGSQIVLIGAAVVAAFEPVVKGFL